MIKIWKYTLKGDGFQVVQMPIASEILSVHEQSDKIVVYALVTVPEGEGDPVLCNKHFKIVATGSEIKDFQGYQFLDTVKLLGGTLMYHVFFREEPI